MPPCFTAMHELVRYISSEAPSIPRLSSGAQNIEQPLTPEIRPLSTLDGFIGIVQFNSRLYATRKSKRLTSPEPRYPRRYALPADQLQKQYRKMNSFFLPSFVALHNTSATRGLTRSLADDAIISAITPLCAVAGERNNENYCTGGFLRTTFGFRHCANTDMTYRAGYGVCQ